MNVLCDIQSSTCDGIFLRSLWLPPAVEGTQTAYALKP